MSIQEFDAVIGAPAHHRVASEDERVRVLETLILPGERTQERTPLHSHGWPAALYVVSGSAFVRRDAEGAVIVDSRSEGICLQPGQALWTGPLEGGIPSKTGAIRRFTSSPPN